MENQQNQQVLETVEPYEAPMLIDLEEFTGCQMHCNTGGSATSQPPPPPV